MGALKLVSRHATKSTGARPGQAYGEGALYVERLGDAIIAEAMELPL